MDNDDIALSSWNILWKHQQQQKQQQTKQHYAFQSKKQAEGKNKNT